MRGLWFRSVFQDEDVCCNVCCKELPVKKLQASIAASPVQPAAGQNGPYCSQPCAACGLPPAADVRTGENGEKTSI